MVFFRSGKMKGPASPEAMVCHNPGVEVRSERNLSAEQLNHLVSGGVDVRFHRAPGLPWFTPH